MLNKYYLNLDQILTLSESLRLYQNINNEGRKLPNLGHSIQSLIIRLSDTSDTPLYDKSKKIEFEFNQAEMKILAKALRLFTKRTAGVYHSIEKMYHDAEELNSTFNKEVENG